ncbi:MAG: GNAT family N-acetyltransferase [Clostridia bacterium]|nr:GNAT family N-acetyltransferase [Clostridia bacterium]
MSIIYSSDFDKINKEELNKLYGEDKTEVFEKSLYKVFAIKDGALAGAARIISEGLETALLVDLYAKDDSDGEIRNGLIKELEKNLIGRRVMVYSSRENLELLEKAGYGRCKNAWTYFREGFEEKDFLPQGFKYENEFIKYSSATVNEPKNTVISYKSGHGDADFGAINEILTRAFFGNPHNPDKTKAVFERSQYSVTAFDGDRLVGVARAVSDGDEYATILNVAVDPEYQGLSIGKNIVLKLSEEIAAGTVVLNTHPGAVGFYNKLSEYRRNKYVFEKAIKEGVQSEQTEAPSEFRNAMFTPAGFRFPDEY